MQTSEMPPGDADHRGEGEHRRLGLGIFDRLRLRTYGRQQADASEGDRQPIPDQADVIRSEVIEPRTGARQC